MAINKEIINSMTDVKHPAINYSLMDLCIIKDVTLENGNTKVLLKFPFPSILIKDILINTITELMLTMGTEIEYKIKH